MRTILPQNTILSRANTVTVDAERFAQLNSLTDIELRQKLSEATAKFVKTYLNHILEENLDFTVGQALLVIEELADEIRFFTGDVKPESVDEYPANKFKPDNSDNSQSNNTAVSNDEADQDDEQNNVSNDVQSMSDAERRARLFNSFNRKRR